MLFQTKDIFFLVTCSFLVMFMQAGFLLLESGLVRAKNSINVAAKNLLDLILVFIAFWIIGFGLMFGDSVAGLWGSSLFVVDKHDVPLAAFFILHAMFCATATTIISGAVSERARLSAYAFIVVLVAIVIYPLFGHWAWGGLYIGRPEGWLQQLGFVDFAGATVVHTLGGAVALAAVLILGPRHGRFDNPDAQAAFKGQNLVISTGGVIFLWIGWFGFNGGANLKLDNSVIGIMLNTAVSGAAGGAAALLYSHLKLKVVDVPLVANGTLAGLVSVTACAHAIDSDMAFLIAVIGTGFMIATEQLLLRWKIDDAVGAIPVHLGAGIWGTLAVALLANPAELGTGLGTVQQLAIQLLGLVVCIGWAFCVAWGAFWLFNRHHPIRVSDHHEYIGLNKAEHNATTELNDLVFEMQHQARSGNFSQHVHVEPFTDIGQIARQYNRVIDKFNAATEEIRQKHQQLSEAHYEIKQTQAHLVQSEKMAGLGEVAAGIAHEINNPVGFVLSNIQTLDQYMSFFNTLIHEYKTLVVARNDENAAREILERIDQICQQEDLEFVLDDTRDLITESIDGVNRVKDIVLNMKTFSHPGGEQRQRTDIAQLMDATLNIIWHELKYKVTVERDYAADLPAVLCSPGQLSQVFMNLMVNAGQAIEDKGVIRLATRQQNDRLIATVSDTGCGISAAQLEQIFQPFFTTKEAGKGTGLGLSLSTGIVEQHGGQLRAESTPGEGTTFTVELPFTTETRAHSATQSSAVQSNDTPCNTTP
ncbi:MAG: ammonium transporter [Marinobacterium sp.]|nr:ammonium transporter [Marinobacterium sp.]